MTFEQFAATRLAAVLRFAAVLTNDRGTAEDVVQEVLVRAHRRWAQIEGLDQPEAYVRRMIVNEYFSWRRKWARYIPRPTDELDGGMPVREQVADPATQVVEHQALLSEVAKLPPKQRTVMVLRYFEDLPDADIAAAMGCAETTVRGYAFRALKTLRIEVAATIAQDV